MSLAGSSSAASGSFTVPLTAMEGITRMRVVMQYDQHGSSCETGYEGETEDYCIEITNVIVVPCDEPTALDTISTTTTSIDINWTGASSASEYSVRYRIFNASTWTYANTTNTNYSITGLIKCNQYEIQVASICDVTNDTSAYTTSMMVNTQCLDNINTIFVSPSISNVKVFPNPMTNYFNVAMQLTENQDVTVQLLNVNGQLIEEQRFSSLIGEQVVQLIPSQSLARGTYIVKVIAEDGIIVRRIVK